MYNASDFKKLVDNVVNAYHKNENTVKIDKPCPINKTSVIDILTKLRLLVFPGYFSQLPLKNETLEYYAGCLIEDIAYHLQQQILRAYFLREGESDDMGVKCGNITMEFLSHIPNIQVLLATDVEAFYDGDPAATSLDEIILSYPGFYALMVHRLAHELYLLDVPTIPRMMTEHAHSLTGIDINPGASIGHHFFMDHGTGVVIGETTTIGDYVKIYQGVTLGALSTRGGQSLRGKKRHPTIEDNVTIYSGASILGGQTVIGKNSVIGSNVFIIKSIEPGTKVSLKNLDLNFNNSLPS
ncbi:MAG: serine O-acetyltransferase [Clostridiales bacterium]|jgi:serine O-acetyltransferase|nr:serine O-acetyltransferase [Clostridiales bacterium]